MTQTTTHHAPAVTSSMRIGHRDIGTGHKPYIIAELGVNHDGDPARALELTDIAADCGVDAIKLQYFEADRLMSRGSRLADYQQRAGEHDPVAMLRRLELNIDQMAPVVQHAHKRGLHAIVTVFSAELIESACRLPWDAFKTASPDIIHLPLFESLIATGRPLIVSTGASTIDEIQRTVCQFYRIDRAEMSSKRRARAVVRPRQVAMYLSKVLTPRSYPEIGRKFGGRDHSTVIHAVRLIEDLRQRDADMDGDVRSLLRQLES